MVPKVLVIEAYETPADVLYLQVAFSLVVREIVVPVVSEARAPVGAPAERTGGVESEEETT